MELFRVAWVDPGRWRRLSQSVAGHPLHVPLELQGAGRFDNTGHYAALYAATEPAAAIGETFGNRHSWSEVMFARPKDDLVRCLVTFEAQVRLVDLVDLVDLDDLATLDELDLRPSDVVRRNQDRTQEVALRLWRTDHEDTHGLCWWSYYRPEWRPVMLWSRNLGDPAWFSEIEVVAVEPLRIDHPAVSLAASVLPRRLEP